MTRSVFYGVSAFVGSITGPTTCSFWPDDPAICGWTSTQFGVDLSKNPEAVRRGTMTSTSVEVDDFAGYNTGGLTTIGPVFTGGATVGLCYVEQSRCAGLGKYDPSKPMAGSGQPYEWCTVVYYDDSGTSTALAGRRFHGFYAEIHKYWGNIAQVSVWSRGTSGAGKGPMGTWAIDLANDAHPIETGLTQIGVAAGVPKAGALFIEWRAGGSVIPMAGPKSPRAIGGAVIQGGLRDR